MTKLTSLQKDAIREATKLDDLDQKHKDLLLGLLKDDDKNNINTLIHILTFSAC